MLFHLYGLFVGTAIVAGAWVVKEADKAFQTSVNAYLSLLVVCGVIGARLYHVADYWQYYGQDPVRIAYLWEGGLGIYGAIIGGIIGLLISVNFSIPKLISCLDPIAIGLPLGQAIGRLGNFFNQELYGKSTNLPWGIYISGKPGRFHPLFAYEAIWDLLIFAVLVILLRQSKRRKSGSYFFAYLFLYGLARFLLEFLRINPWTIAGVNVAQGISLIAMAVGLHQFFWYDIFYGRR